MEAKCFYPDITELGGLNVGGMWVGPVYQREDFSTILDKHASKVSSEFAFCVTSASQMTPNGGSYNVSPYLRDAGWRLVGQKLNWYPSHNGDHCVGVWFKRLRTGGVDMSVVQPRQCYNGGPPSPKNLVWSSCGAKFLVGLSQLRWGNKMLSLARLPVDIPLRWKPFLKVHGWRHVDTGQLASYWVNGWEPADYPGETAERKMYAPQLPVASRPIGVAAAQGAF